MLNNLSADKESRCHVRRIFIEGRVLGHRAAEPHHGLRPRHAGAAAFLCVRFPFKVSMPGSTRTWVATRMLSSRPMGEAHGYDGEREPDDDAMIANLQ